MGCGASKQMAQGQTTTRSVAPVAPIDDKGAVNKGQIAAPAGIAQQATGTVQKTRSPTAEQGTGSQLQVDGAQRMSHQGSYQESSSRGTAASTMAIRGASQTDLKVRDSNTAIKSSHAGISHSPTTEADRPSGRPASLQHDNQSDPHVQADNTASPHKEVSRSAYLAMQTNMVEDTGPTRSKTQLAPKSKAVAPGGEGSTAALKTQSNTALAMNTALPASRNDLATSTSLVHRPAASNPKNAKSQSINNLTAAAGGNAHSHTALAMNTALPASRNDLLKSQASVSANNTSATDGPKKSQSVQHLASRTQISNGDPSAALSTTALALTTALPLSNANLLSQESVSPQHEVADLKGHTALPGGSNSNVTKIMSGSQHSLTDGLIGHDSTLPEHEVADAKGHTALPGGSNTALAKIRSGSLHSLKDGDTSRTPVAVANSEGPTQMAQKSYSRSGSRASLPPALETVTEVVSPTSAASNRGAKVTSEPNIAVGFVMSVEETPQEKVVEPVMSDAVAWELARTRPLPASTNELSKTDESQKSQGNVATATKAKKAVSVTELASPTGRGNAGVKKAESKGDALDLATRKPLPPSTNELVNSSSHNIKKAESKADALEAAARKPLPPSTYDLTNGSGASKGSKADLSSGHRRPPSGGMVGSPATGKQDGGSRPSSTGSAKKMGSNPRVSDLGSRKGSAGSARRGSRPASGAHA